MADNQTPNPPYGQAPNQGMPPYPIYQERPRRRRSSWWVPLLIIGIILVLIAVFVFVVIGVIGNTFEKEQVEVQKNSVLYLTLEGVQEQSESNPFSIFGGGTDKANFYEILRGIERAKDDDKIRGIYLESKIISLGAAKADEIQAALDDFKKSGKFIFSFIESGTEINYYNALPSDKIFMAQEGMVEMNGFGGPSLFLKGLFNKFGIDFYVQQFEDFKSAGESMSRTSYSDSARKEMHALLNQRMDWFLAAANKYRKLDPKMVLAAMNRGIYSADSMLALGFIDGIATESQVKEKIKKLVYGEKAKKKDDVEFISINRYVSSKHGNNEKVEDHNKQIAVVYASGEIQSGKSQGWTNKSQILSDDFIKNLRKAREDKDIKAIIIRIDSPGGSVIASDEIYNEIIETRKVKPVYASMSDVAASGGYYMAMACDTIIAHPQTITGSIGVILMIPNTSGLLTQFGVTVDTVSTGPATNFMNPVLPFADSDKNKLYNLSKSIYHRFVGKAAQHRKKSFEEMRSVAKGRVWTGADAKAQGLVDILGGFSDAVKIAKKRIGLKEDDRAIIKFYPGKEDDIKSLFKIFGLDNDDEASMSLKDMAASLGMSPLDFAKQWYLLDENTRAQIEHALNMMAISRKEKALIEMPYIPNF